MAITTDTQKDLISLVVGMFNAAPGNAILTDLAEASLSGASDAQLANLLAGTAEFRSLYPVFLTHEQFATRLVDNMVGDLLDADLKEWAVDQLVGALNAGASRGETALGAITALRAVSQTDADWGAAATAFANKVEVATYFSVDQLKNGDSLASLQAVVAGVDNTAASVDAAKAAIDGAVEVETVFFLSADRDIENGTAGADKFIADVVQVGGLQVNSLGNGDRIDGRGGVDVLEAQVTRGATFGDSNMAIQARTTSVENIFLEALNADMPNQGVGSAENTTVYVNAGDMTSVNQLWSNKSGADLIVQNLTTRNDAGQLRLTSDVTIGMTHTGNADSNWQESNYHVFFAQNNLLKDVEATTSASSAYYWLADQDSDDFAAEPLQNIDRDGVFFSLNGTRYELHPADEAALGVNTWEDYADLLRDELAALVAAGKTELAGVTISVNSTNTRDTFDDNGNVITISAIQLTDSNGGEFSQLGYMIPENNVGSFNVFGRTGFEDPTTTTSEYVTSNIVLEKVGRGADGGELVVGGMNKNSENSFNGVQGVERFNVTVLGGEELPNSLSGLHSTNNQLQIVNIASSSSSGSYAGLKIGNSNTSTGAAGLKDVQLLNAADFLGNLAVTADITTDTFRKYFNFTDTGASAASDNVHFEYNLTGSGNNRLELSVAQEVAAYEDFSVAVVSGSGNDYIKLQLDDDTSSLNNNWYQDQKALKNASIATGDGNDTVWTPGSGDVIISTGAGNDTVYTDNTGSITVNAGGASGIIPAGTEVKAHWITNAQDLNIHDTLGAGAGSNYFLFNTTLTVTLSSSASGPAAALTNGYEVRVNVPTSNGYVGNHTHINQAIKTAINSDPVMSKLLVAKDGPNNSVVIESLIDGEFAADDLIIGLTAPTSASVSALNAGALQALQTAYADFTNVAANSSATAATIQGAIAQNVTDITAAYQGLGGSSLASDGTSIPGTPAVLEQQTVDFAGLAIDAAGAGDFTINLDGTVVTVTVPSSATAAAIATATAAAINADAAAIAAGHSATAAGSVVTITYGVASGDAPAAILADVDADFVTTVGVGESQTIDFTGVAGYVTGNFGVGGVLVNILATDTAAEIATKTAAAINAAGTMSAPLGTVTATVAGNIVTVNFAGADGDVADITISPGSSGLNGGVVPVVGDALVVDNAPAGVPAGTIVPASTADVTDDVVGFVVAGPGVPGLDITGDDSTAETDNTINLGTGQDVVVLSTSVNANETLVWTGLNNGKNTIVNFEADPTVAAADKIDFSAYLTSQTGTTAATAVDIATTVQTAAGPVSANEVVVVNFTALGFTGTANNWANLTASSLQTQLNSSGSWTVGSTTGLLGTTQKAVFMIENTDAVATTVDNAGEYKIFEVQLTNTAGSTGFTVLGEIGVADFGSTLTNIGHDTIV